MQDFRDLKMWDKAHRLTLAVYRMTASFPREELYGLTSQLRRATSSIPANIAEGCGRNSGKDLRRSLEIALGSASEVEYHLLLARDLAFLEPETHNILNTQVCEIKRMLSACIDKLTTDKLTTPPQRTDTC
jgi:four helix bundle protein